MNRINFEPKNKENGWNFNKEIASNFFKGLEAYFAVVLTSVSLIILISIVYRWGSFEVYKLLAYLIISVLLLIFYSVATTNIIYGSSTYKIRQTIKRIFDVVFTALYIFLVSPLLLFIAIAIRIESPGPILFPSARIGQHGKLFYIYRFRTMSFVPDRSSVTRIGKLLLSLSLNILPMFINILNGELSIIGPMPRSPEDILKINNKYDKILTVKPGLLGTWEYSSTYQESIELDLKYIENWSLLQDFKILIKILFGAFSNVFTGEVK